MQERIFILQGDDYKRLAVTDREIWITDQEVDTREALDTAVHTAGAENPTIIPIASVTKVAFHTLKSEVDLTYSDANDGVTEQEVSFENEETAQEFGEYMGQQLSGARIEAVENKVPIALVFLAFVIGVLGITYFLTTLVDDDSLESGGSRRSRSRIAIIRFVVNTLGEMGLWIVGGLIAAFIAYLMYDRYTNPGNNIVYTRS